MTYGGFWIRFVAHVIDITLVFAFLTLMEIAGLPFLSNNSFTSIAVLLYFTILESSAKQATFGKQFLGLKVVDMNGRRISVMHAFGRNVAKILSGLLLCVGYILAAFTIKKQALHDLIAKTIVLRR